MLEIVWNLVFEIAAGALGDHLEDSYEESWNEIERQGKIEQLSDAISAFLNKEAELKKLIDNIKEEIEKKRKTSPEEKLFSDEEKKNKLQNFLMMIANDSKYRSTFKKSLETTEAFRNSAIEQQKHIKDFFCVIADICVDMLGSDKEQIKKYCEDLAERNEESFKRWKNHVDEQFKEVKAQLDKVGEKIDDLNETSNEMFEYLKSEEFSRKQAKANADEMERREAERNKMNENEGDNQ